MTGTNDLDVLIFDIGAEARGVSSEVHFAGKERHSIAMSLKRVD